MDQPGADVDKLGRCRSDLLGLLYLDLPVASSLGSESTWDICSAINVLHFCPNSDMDQIRKDWSEIGDSETRTELRAHLEGIIAGLLVLTGLIRPVEI